MKRYLIMAAGALLLMSACQETRRDKEMEDSIRMATMTQQYQEAANFNDSLLLLMGDIYAGLDSINMQEGLLITPGIGDNVNKRAEIRENLAIIRQRLQTNRQMLADLESKSAKQSKQSAVLEKTISQLKSHIEEQDARIAQLTTALEGATVTIENLRTTVATQEGELANLNEEKDRAEAQAVAAANEANRVYYVVGDSKQLKEYGVLQKKFLGVTKVMQSDDINFSCFTVADKRQLKTIPTNAKKIEVKSLNDESSYRIDGEKNEPKTLVITNPGLFWQKTPYLVIETK